MQTHGDFAIIFKAGNTSEDTSNYFLFGFKDRSVIRTWLGKHVGASDHVMIGWNNMADTQPRKIISMVIVGKL